MATRISEKDLDYLETRLRTEFPDADFRIGCAYGGWRLERKGGSVDVSPRLPKAQLYDWMHAFLDGVDYAAREMLKKVEA